MTTDQLRNWLSSPDRRELIKINVIESRMGVARGTIQHWLNGKRGLAEYHLPALQKELELLKLPD